MDAISGNVIAVILGVEKYRYSDSSPGISDVDFAINDAKAFKSVLLDTFKADKENITEWINEDLLRVSLENDLPYIIKNLTEDDLFVFYYAGHGFYSDGYNRLTAWDTHPGSLEETTVCIKKVLLEPLEKSNCKKFLIFIDSCAKNLKELSKGRSIVSNLSEKEFREFIRINKFGAFFFSCMPGEKAFPSKTLNHGIWTYHLVKALRGEDQQAIERDNTITDCSLRDYLKVVVPTYIRKRTELIETQTPYAIISAPNSFAICEFKSAVQPDLPALKITSRKYCLRKIEEEAIKDLPGFDKRKGHFVPSDYSSKTSSFVQRLLSESVEDELKAVYNDAKGILKLKRKDIDRTYHDGGGTVETEMFRYYIDTHQDKEEPSNALVVRKLVIRAPIKSLPQDFDAIFPCRFDEIVFKIETSDNFDVLVDQFENLAEANGAEVYEDEDNSVIVYSGNNFEVVVKLDAGDLIIVPQSRKSCLELINFAGSIVLSIGSSMKSIAI